jgi:4-alpha-methyl-delta7-sterol-4alpha-methyl oxidase
MQDIIAIYREPLFFLFPVASTLIGVGAFLAIALPMTWLAMADPKRLRAYRLQDAPPPDKRYFWPSLGRLAVNVFCVLVLAVALWPLLRMSGVHSVGLPSWYDVAWQLPAFLIIDDVCFYFLHRSIHGKWLYRHVHAIHHRVRAPSAIAGGYSHPVEYTLISVFAMIGPLAFGSHIVTIWIWAVLRQWLAADGHSGYALPFSPGRLLPGYESPAFHDYHHKRVVGNYANIFPWLDRWLGTLSKGYLDHRSARAGSSS